ncbi:hypothetical protein GGX14DRAFT_698523 [Mycena pura]|uniref:Uncharacterized protein n=1 Tax=Mycena pura TaxID=153505 RepID=A0AAD6YAE8_9AGAR|nr:hypothetical protein GGX14DRAFT_698523 [Mycena pura]
MRSLSVLQLAPFDTTRVLVTSPFLRPSVLGAIRLVIACYTLVTLVFSVARGIKDAALFFPLFTHLTYSGLCVYFFAAGLQTAVYARHREKGYPLQGSAKPWRFLYLALLSTITVFPFLVTTMFWALVYNSSTFASGSSGLSAISEGLLSAVFALFEILLTDTPASAWLLLPFGILLLLLYIGLGFIVFATQGSYTVAQNTHPLQLALNILTIVLIECAVFAIVHWIVALRQRVVARFVRAEVKATPWETEGLIPLR